MRGVTHRVKSPRTACVTDSVGQHRSHYQLRVAGTLRLSTVVVSDSFLESGTTASESVVHDKIQLKRALRLTTISSAESVVGELANFVVAVDSPRPA